MNVTETNVDGDRWAGNKNAKSGILGKYFSDIKATVGKVLNQQSTISCFLNVERAFTAKFC